jgi:hypothetical protein
MGSTVNFAPMINVTAIDVGTARIGVATLSVELDERRSFATGGSGAPLLPVSKGLVGSRLPPKPINHVRSLRLVAAGAPSLQASGKAVPLARLVGVFAAMFAQPEASDEGGRAKQKNVMRQIMVAPQVVLLEAQPKRAMRDASYILRTIVEMAGLSHARDAGVPRPLVYTVSTRTKTHMNPRVEPRGRGDRVSFRGGRGSSSKRYTHLKKATEAAVKDILSEHACCEQDWEWLSAIPQASGRWDTCDAFMHAWNFIRYYARPMHLSKTKRDREAKERWERNRTRPCVRLSHKDRGPTRTKRTKRPRLRDTTASPPKRPRDVSTPRR